eukprot:1405589-Amphidinium_carterae.2
MRPSSSSKPQHETSMSKFGGFELRWVLGGYILLEAEVVISRLLVKVLCWSCEEELSQIQQLSWADVEGYVWNLLNP